MALVQPRCFSRCGNYLACCSSEGLLKIWHSKTGALQQTLTSSHLRGVVSCLAWSREKQNTKKRRSSYKNATLFIGGGVGSKVMVWNISRDEEVVLEGHSDEVTCVDWDKKLFYSGSKDRHVMEWNADSGELLRKWKADKMSVQCICCYGDGSLLLTAGRAIKLWSLTDCSLMKRVSGHAAAINRLAFVTRESFLSSATHERVINYWQTSVEGSTAVAAITCEEEVQFFASAVEGELAKVAVVSDEGNLFLYKLPLSPLPSAPISHTYSILFVNSPPKPNTACPLPVLTVQFPQDTTDTLALAHSSLLAPAIESIEFEQSSPHSCLVRAGQPAGLLLPVSQLPSAQPPPDAVTLLGPGNMTMPTQQVPSSADQVPLQERLQDTVETAPKKARGPLPSADSLTQLLVQAVTSGDGKLLEEVLRVTKHRLVMATVKQLPVHSVLPFLKKLVDLLQSTPARGLDLSLWIKTILSAHAAYLMTVPHLPASLSALHQLLEVRVHTFSRLCQLQGKLDLMIAQGEVSEEVADSATAAHSDTDAMEEGEESGGDGEESDAESASEHSSEGEEDVSMASNSSEETD